MALLLKTFWTNASYIYYDVADERTKDWFLISSLPQTLMLVFAYLLFIMKIGPMLMANRKPFNLDKIMIAYNGVQVALCGYLVIRITPYVFKSNLACTEIDFGSTPDLISMIKLGYIYFLLKILDLLDTIFFVLRKRQKQVTFLHVYHHGGMVVVMWIGMRYIAGGHSVFLPYLNSCVHTVMYAYYLLTAWKKEYKESIWWKKYITQMQLIQFGLFVIIYGIPLFNVSCNFPRVVLVPLIAQFLIMFVLFSDFYYKAYIKSK